ncbi:hypothetical protein [Myxococcus sp. CA040A]|uniref:hypothetical protein n=1 Tax=Myxococcus sp. CA040A TaxID=2741738 RepID=UPI00157A3A5C|nr:hypothetical protein [Myxococcus sp. CA040A]NTX04120.1 hypothetical protein [Myxococcus sp. CA040A]
MAPQLRTTSSFFEEDPDFEVACASFEEDPDLEEASAEEIDFCEVSGEEMVNDEPVDDWDPRMSDRAPPAWPTPQAEPSRDHRPPPPRRVSLAFQRLETALPAGQEALPPGKKISWLPGNVSLCQQKSYRLWLRIGRELPASLLKESPPPPLDDLLPPSEGGHSLHVAVFGEDFTVEGDFSKIVFLPSQGDSAAVGFVVRAPALPGIAKLGVALYHHRHLLQAFTIQARVEAMERINEGCTVVTAKLEGGSTSKFTNLSRLWPRALSIFMVDEKSASGPGVLSLRAFARGGATTLRLSELMTAESTATYRRILQESSVDPLTPDEPRFLAYPPSLDAQRPGVESVLAKLGRLGCDLYRALLLEVPESAQVFESLSTRRDEVIQVLRTRPAQTYPWPILYDFPEPDERVGVDVPVCLGFGPNGRWGECGCPRADRWCAQGFWGVRLQVEELFGEGVQADVVVSIEQPDKGNLVAVACGDRDGGSERMRNDLSVIVSGQRLKNLDLSEDVLAPLWSAERPPVFIVLGHLETRELQGQPRGPRIVLLQNEKWLQGKHVIDRCRGGKTWGQQPHTLVMVLSCASGAIEPVTVTDFVRAFRHAGAAAVVGTECTAFSGLLGRFGTHVTGSLLAKRTLGWAITDFRRQLLRERNPLGFIFNVVGSADLVLTSRTA